MPFDQDDASAEQPQDARTPVANSNSKQPPVMRRRRRFVTRRNAIILTIAIVVGIAALIILGLLSYRLGYVDRYVAGQIKNTLATYGIRAEIKTFHTAITPQTVEMLGVELYDAKTGEKLGKIDRLLATVRIEDLYALNLHRNINLKDLQVEGLELWVNFDAEGKSNFRNLHIPPPEPNARILFAYSTAHIELKNALIHYGDVVHSLSGEARNIHATIQPDDPNAPAASRMNAVALTASNSVFVYDGRSINEIGLEANGRVNETRAEIQNLTLRSPVAEAHLQGVMDDWRALRYHFNITSSVDLTQASDFLRVGTTLRGAGNFVGTVNGEGDKFQIDGSIKSDALAADGIRLQGLNLTAKGSVNGKTYDLNARAVAELLAAGDFQLNAVQLTGGVMGTGTDFRWVGELRAAAEKGYGTTITGLILRDARADYRDGVLTAAAPQFSGTSLSSADLKVQKGIQANDLRVKSANGVTTATIASAKAGKVVAANATFDGITLKNIDVNSRGGVTIVNIKDAQVGDASAFGATTGSINIAGVRLSIHGSRLEGSSNDFNVGAVTLKDGHIENAKVAHPVFVIEPSGRYRVSSDLSIGGGVIGKLNLGPAHASLVATADQVQVSNFSVEALDGRANGNATIARTKNGTSRVNANFENFDLAGAITLLSDRVVPLTSKATGKAELSFTGTDFSNATGTVNAQLRGGPAGTSDLAPLSGDLSVTADRGLFQIQLANLQTTATKLSATGQFSIDQPTSNLRVDVASTDAGELQRLLITSGAVPELEEQFRTYGIDLGGRLSFNGTLNGALKDPIVSGHAELGSLIMNGRDLGSLTANLSSTTTETRVTDGRLAQPNGGGAQFALVVPRTGENNTSIEATLDRMNAGNLIAALPLQTATREQVGDSQADVSGTVKITGIPNAMSGVADLRSGSGRLAGEPLQSFIAHATFSGSTVNLDKFDANFDSGHLVANGTYDTATKLFDFKASGDRIQLERLEAFANKPNLPKLTGTAVIKSLSARGTLADVSSYQITFDAESNDVAIDGRAAGSLKLVGETQNEKLAVTFTSTGFLGDKPQFVTANVDLSACSTKKCEKLPAEITSTIANADLTQLLKILLPQADVTGQASATLKLSGSLLDEDGYLSTRGLTGTANISTLTINVAELNLSAAGPVVIDFTPGELNVHETKFTGTETNVTLGGKLATAEGGAHALAVNGQINLRILGLFSKDVFSSGFARLDVDLGGTYEKPRLTGRASVNGGSVSVLLGDQRATLSNIEAALVFNSTQAQIERLKARMGAGQVTATGGAQLSGFSVTQFLFNIQADNVTLSYPEDFRSTVNADLRLRGTQDIQFISGDVHVRRTEYTKNIDLAQLLNQRPQTSIEEGGEFKFTQTAVFDKLRVEGRNALVLHNNLGDLIASVDLQLNGEVKNPLIEGRITATRGTLNFRNNPFEITRGLIDFPARLNADPILNIAGQSVIRGYRVNASIQGPLSHPETTVSSEPALPQGDVVSLILNGTLSSTDTSTSVLAQSGLGTAASLLTDALINAPVSRATNKLFGLSRLEITPVIGGAGSAPTARLTVARRLSKDITVTYSTNIASDPNQVLSVEYRVSNRISFVADYEQGSQRNLSTRNNNYSFEIRFRKRF
jgi:translocation and assembly module TamB